MGRVTKVAILTGIAVAIALYVIRLEITKPNTGLTKVTVAQVGNFFVYMPLYIAEEKGFFKEQGLDVAIINTGGDDKSVSAVIAGDADFGVGDPTFAAIAGLQGQKVLVVAGILDAVPFWGVTKNAKVPLIVSPSQLAGFSVATFPSPSTAYALQAQMFRQGGLEPNIKQVQFGSLIPLLDTKTVDIVLELEPNVSIAVTQGARVVYSLAATSGPFATTGVTVTEKTLSSKRDLVIRFVKAINEAESFAHKYPNQAVLIAQQQFPNIDKYVVALALNRMIVTNAYPATAMISQLAWQNAIKLRVESGEIRSISDAQPYLDNSIALSVQEK